MAYSDYGGYAYRNGERVEERSDAVIRPDMVNVGAAGAYPGFVALAAGQTLAQFEQVRDASLDGHVVLGDGPVFAVMYKSCHLMAYRLVDGAFVKAPELDGLSGYDLAKNDAPAVIFDLSGHKLEVLFEQTDNYYQYARLTHPDGTVWTGFSGYGVGAGLEDCGYGYSTEDQIDRLQEVFA
ncbi:hypothetical protein [Sphingomonas sp. NIC1]|uniref:hypothetical protein n=1 Tax=Sphingomonas sp. NIC1 TaxID=1961362 RepID=UPI0007C0F241|nr:hypothetical protein [Sphingomonas sp. NIC1]ANC87298.1 hypothetical protein A7E77_10555 [Sphingomonas sp. NIC1]